MIGCPSGPYIRWPDKISRVRWARGGKHVGDEDQVCHFFIDFFAILSSCWIHLLQIMI